LDRFHWYSFEALLFHLHLKKPRRLLTSKSKGEQASFDNLSILLQVEKTVRKETESLKKEVTKICTDVQKIRADLHIMKGEISRVQQDLEQAEATLLEKIEHSHQLLMKEFEVQAAK
jgi:septal ring factor EnvC (AmiA/AmiB activator)